MHVRAEAGVKGVRELHDRVVADVVVEHAVRRERRGVAFGIAGIERPVVARIQLLDFDQVVGGQLAAGLLRRQPRAVRQSTARPASVQIFLVTGFLSGRLKPAQQNGCILERFLQLSARLVIVRTVAAIASRDG